MGPLWGKNVKKSLGGSLSRDLLDYLVGKEQVVFDNNVFSTQRMKSSFLYNFWSWTYLYFVDKPSSLIEVLTLMGCR